MKTVYNMPSGVPFLRSLAHGLYETYGDRLHSGLVLLPTRRAANALAQAFVRQAARRGVDATLLPRLRPLADVNPDEPPFEPGELAGRVSPGIDPVRRRFEIAKLVAHYHARAFDLPLDPAAALNMADPLIAIMDDAALEEVTIADHDEWARVCEQAAIHFQHAATLYKIIDAYWPERLRELDMMEPQARRVALLDALADIWTENPPDYPVVVAGSTGTLKATARLMRVVADMPNGMVVLPGLQEDFPQRVWDTIDGRHPQSSLKGLLDVMGVSRTDVPLWPWVVDGEDRAALKKRRRILAEALVPVDATGDWLDRIDTLTSTDGEDIFDVALDGLSLIEARTDEEEALAIALILREAMEIPGRTVALVTPDQLLAQRVQTRMSRWNVDLSMSQGVPLEQTAVGIFLIALLELAQDPYGPVELNLVLTHNLCSMGEPVGHIAKAWRALELRKFRGSRPVQADMDEMELVTRVQAGIQSLTDLQSAAAPDQWAKALIATAETVASTDLQSGASRLWTTDAGRQAAKLLEDIIDYGGSLPKTDVNGFMRFLSAVLQSAVVRPSQVSHPRVSILGPLEARLLEADVIILGSLNEGTWPGTPASGPFLSRGMRKAMKLSLPERRYGLAAHDFAELAANKTVYLTRSLKDDRGPTVASRWVWRLKTLLAGAKGDKGAGRLLGTGQKYLDWTRTLDRPDTQTFISRPSPKPPVDKRWARKDGRTISITGAAKWVRDPYSIFAKQTLRLDVLDPLDAPLGPRDYGNALHDAFEQYVRDVDEPDDPSHRSYLIDLLSQEMIAQGYTVADVAKDRPRFEVIADALIAWFADRKAKGFDIVGPEIKAKCRLDDLDFTLRGKLDLVEKGPEGFAFTDYKTGTPPSAKEIAAGFDLQLPLAGYLAQVGALKGISETGSTVEMGYIKASGSSGNFKYDRVDKKPGQADELVDQSIEILRKLITAFDNPETGYDSQPRAKFVNQWGDYDDLARRAEWSSFISGEE